MAVVSGAGSAAGSAAVDLAGVGVRMAFCFAWVDDTDTTFLDAFKREDEQVQAFTLDHAEGQFATLQITVQRLASGGYLAPSRKRWAWLAYDDGATVTPLFFGRLVGFPQEISGEIVRLDFVARPKNWFRLKSAAAQAMKVAPFYDPVWIAPDKRRDPDVVLEARPERWHIDRVTHAVTTSNIIVGEDGTLDIGGDYFYDSLRVSYGQIAGRRVTVQAQVNWTQRAEGALNLSFDIMLASIIAGSTQPFLITSYTGEGLARDWPKAGQNIGGGWKFGPSFPLDRTGISVNTLLDVGTFDGNTTTFSVWGFIPFVTVEYEANRPRVERVLFTLDSDVQDLATEPEDEEIIMLSLTSQDVGQPIDALVTPPEWTPSTEYRLNSIVTSNGAIYRCVAAGTSGSVAPDDISASIVDGTCIWAWVSFETQIDLQSFVLPWTPSTAYVAGDYVQNGGVIYQCVTSGTSAASGGPQGYRSISWSPDSTYFANDMVVSGGQYYVALNDGVSGAQGPIPFTVSKDGSIQWAWIPSLAAVNGWIDDGTAKWVWFNAGIPIGDFGRRQFFATDRGTQSIEYLICLARARLLARARAVSVSVSVPFDVGLGLSCRQNVWLEDARIPGGEATGKVTSYRLAVEGTSGKAICDITIGCTIGKGGTATASTGSPGYVESGYVNSGWQQHEGGAVLPDSIDDLTYTQFEATPVYDDGIDFTAFNNSNAILQLTVINGEMVQRNAINYVDTHFRGFIETTEVLAKFPTMVDLYLKPVQGVQFQTDYALALSKLQIAKTIDLEA